MQTVAGNVGLTVQDGVGVILVDRPPVNAIDAGVRAGIIEAVTRADADPDVKAIVMACAGGVFLSGADLNELRRGIQLPSYRETLDCIEMSSKPVIAALAGTTLGGGVEVAMACHYRLASADAKLGMPEVHMAIVPGAGGTQRLPRLIGAKAALRFLLQGAPVSAPTALELGLIDKVTQPDVRAAAIAFAKSLIAANAGPRRTRDQPVDVAGFDEATIAEMLQEATERLPGQTTPRSLAILIQTAADTPLEKGLIAEKTLSDESLRSAPAQALIKLFFAERETGRVRGLAKGGSSKPIGKVAVIGAGTMGAGIVMTLADAGLRTSLLSSRPESLARGLQTIRDSYDASLKRGRLEAKQVDGRLSLIEGVTSFQALADADVVIEAVIEDMSVKKSVLMQLDQVLGPDAIIATNTSSLSVTELAAATGRAPNVIGLHFFSPAHVMRLLEIVRGEQTSSQTVATALALAKILRKIGVLAADRFGFIGNRMMLDGYWREAELVMLEGEPPERIDAVAEAFGFAMGPMRVNDMAGIDIGAKVRAELALREERPAPYGVISDELARRGRLGQKVGQGVYRYEGGNRRPLHDPQLGPIVQQLANEYGIAPRAHTDLELQERLVLGLIHIGSQVLEEGVAQRASDIDVVWTSGYGFPRWRGGPMTYADALGLDHVLNRLDHYRERFGDWWRPTDLLQKLAASRSSFQEWDAESDRRFS